MSTPNSTTVAPTTDPARQAWRDRVANPEPIPAHEFDPPPPIAEQILSDAANHTIHLADIAAKAHTTIETLCLWLARPDIAARSDAIEAVVRRRARLAALNTVPEIIEVCATIMERYRRAPDRGPDDYQDPRTHAIQIRNAANALMAARIHIYLTRTLERPPTLRRAPSDAPAPNPAPTPASDPTTDAPKRINIAPRLPDVGLNLNLHDAREANLTTRHNPAHNNIAKSLSHKREEPHTSPAVTNTSHTQRPNPAEPIAAHTSDPTTPNPTAPPPAPCSCHAKSPDTRTPCRDCSSTPHPAATIITIAGTTTRSRDPTPSHR